MEPKTSITHNDATVITITALSDQIDNLLERYLPLLHEYTTLRDELNTLQSTMYQSLARANFAAERGIRFGQDYYDDRMQASRRVAVSLMSSSIQDSSSSSSSEGVRKFTVFNPHIDVPISAEVATGKEEQGDEKASAEEKGYEKEEDGGNDKPTAEPSPSSTSSHKPKQPTEPLRWFGLLSPPALRQAQAQSVRAVEEVIPRLVSVNAEMAGLEIEIRRAKKRRGKTIAAEMKKLEIGRTGEKEEDRNEAVVAV
ncbi:hypothetical protein F5Y16DRAFT_401983 [Xylariaceae sp. FL0255]|nr:hypothetical protein F5Y16DRAFT_401983 [Xylariaceae sp. FL0255]